MLNFGFGVNGVFRSGINYTSWFKTFVDKLEECKLVFVGNGDSNHFEFYISDSTLDMFNFLTMNERIQEMCEWFDKESHNNIRQYQLIWL